MKWLFFIRIRLGLRLINLLIRGLYDVNRFSKENLVSLMLKKLDLKS